MFNLLRENLANQMYMLWHLLVSFSSVQVHRLFWCCTRTRASVAGPYYQQRHSSSSSQISATSAKATGEHVIRFGVSFLNPNNGVDTNFQYSGSIENAGTIEDHLGDQLFNA